MSSSTYTAAGHTKVFILPSHEPLGGSQRGSSPGESAPGQGGGGGGQYMHSVVSGFTGLRHNVSTQPNPGHHPVVWLSLDPPHVRYD